MDRRISWTWWALVGLLALGLTTVWLAAMARTVAMAADTASQPLAKVEFTVSVTGPNETIDGADSGNFKATVKPAQSGTITYEWRWKAPDKAGNNPQVNFEHLDQAETIVKIAHWFALPDKPVGASFRSTYRVYCKVTSNGETHESNRWAWAVFVPNPAGKTPDPRILAGTLDMVKTPQNQWRLASQANIVRNVPQPTVNLPAASQFYPKIKAHEDRHLLQNMTGVPGVQKQGLWNANKLYNQVLKRLRESTPDRLRMAVDAAVTKQNDIDDAKSLSLLPAAEADAHYLSSNIRPYYLDWYPPKQ